MSNTRDGAGHSLAHVADIAYVAAVEAQAARDIAEVPAVEVITAAAVHLMSAAAVKCGLAEDVGAPISTRHASSSRPSPPWSRPPHRRSATSTPGRCATGCAA